MSRSKENFIRYTLGFLLAFIALNAFGGGYYGMSVFARFRFARISAFTAVGIVFVWLAIQLSVIGYVFWMQPTTASLGLWF